ncbi:hypothetical protein BUALT_Bualt06G0074400 [Buddleja alternifolia]|uniref:RING-type domain-containing protein n=1 Tax=Buddleja alternifolia TaxID=168488 RepID=A0AAV6XDL7_9LAMI|nr:hypothetical protein BUALT_Bualt06G0074400 [Buddleja alternifolia]
METSDSDATNLDSASPSSPRNGARILQFPALRFLQFPISSLLEYSGVLRPRPEYPYSDASPLLPETTNATVRIQNPSNSDSINSNGDVGVSTNSSNSSGSNGEVAIRIIGDNDRIGVVNNGGENGAGSRAEEESMVGADDVNGNNTNGSDDNHNREAPSYQRYDIQQVARWVEQILPFSLLLLVVFIRQHLPGTIKNPSKIQFGFYCLDKLSSTCIFKPVEAGLSSFDATSELGMVLILEEGERRISVLVGYSVVFMFHVFGIYWWHRGDDLFYPLLMIPPKAIPSFWHAIFIILVNDTMARQTAMVLKLVLLMYHKNGRGHNFRRQGQILTLVEYTLLLYRALLPAPVWYRFFLNKDYGSLFSSLTTGLYLTIKLTSMVEKVRSFFTALKALSRQDVHYGSYATSEQVNAAGDLCAICQEKMHAPILLRCKHIFCEDCVSEWFERERTCPLCRALVRPADLRSYGDGSTSLFFQLF